MLWRIRWEDLQFESPNKYHKRAGSRLTLSQVRSGPTATLKDKTPHTGLEGKQKLMAAGRILAFFSASLWSDTSVNRWYKLFFWQVTFTALPANKDATLVYRFHSHAADPCDAGAVGERKMLIWHV